MKHKNAAIPHILEALTNNDLAFLLDKLIQTVVDCFVVGSAGGSAGPEAWWQVHLLRVQQSDKSCIGKVSRSAHSLGKRII